MIKQIRRRKSNAELAAERFDCWAPTYGEDRISSWFRFYQSLALSKLDIEQGEGFLDIGCGSGWAVRQAADRLRSGQACGIDIAPQMVAKATASSVTYKNTEFRLADAETIPYPDHSFHSILCTHSFHHYAHPVETLSEIRRVLKPDGTFVLLDPARDTSWAIWVQDRMRRYLEKSHIRYYTTHELVDLLKRANWRLQNSVSTVSKFRDHGKLFTGLMIAECRR